MGVGKEMRLFSEVSGERSLEQTAQRAIGSASIERQCVCVCFGVSKHA